MGYIEYDDKSPYGAWVTCPKCGTTYPGRYMRIYADGRREIYYKPCPNCGYLPKSRGGWIF